MKFSTKTADEVRVMHEESKRALSSESPPAVNEKSPLRIKFEANLYRWSQARPQEAERLANQLTIWANATEEKKTLWELIEERLMKLVEGKYAYFVMRPIDRNCGKIKAVPNQTAPEEIIKWLFESPIADEWMNRFLQKF